MSTKININTEGKTETVKLKKDEVIEGKNFSKDKDITIIFHKNEFNEVEVEKDRPITTKKLKADLKSEDAQGNALEVKNVEIEVTYSRGFFYDGGKFKKVAFASTEYEFSQESEIKIASDLWGMNWWGWVGGLFALASIALIGWYWWKGSKEEEEEEV